MSARRHGFTLVELLITMTIMVILMALAIISLRSSQVDARDAKRAGDIQTIARGLEVRYRDGFHAPSAGWLQSFSQSMVDYPSVEEINYALGGSSSSFNPSTATSNFIVEDLPGTSSANFSPPNTGTFRTICPTSASCGAAEQTSITAATIGNDYVYEPIDANNQVCMTVSSDCVRFNLYYVKEKTGLLQPAVRSNHQ